MKGSAMKTINRIYVLFFLAMAGLGAVQFYGSEALAHSNYFTDRGCTGCHTSPVAATCNGCHHHGNKSLAAATDKKSYTAGETLTATLSGGSKSGWIRAILYDQNNVQIAVSSGNASGKGSSTTFPAPLSAPAPTTPGTYTWKMAYFGNQNGTGTGDVHSEVRVNTNSFTVTASPKAMIGTTGYPSLTAAYTAAATVATIMTADVTLVEDFNMSLGKDITLDGGYDALFQTLTGQPTSLQGTLTIATGSLTVEGLAIM
jgi:hypothetical protein